MSFIGISQRLVETSSYYEIREALSLEWGRFFTNYLGGYLPLPLSYEVEFKHYLSSLKAVILSGGNDLSAFSSEILSQMRDSYEIKIIKACVQNHIPVLGICRGAQIIAQYFRSSLQQYPNHVGHHIIKEITTAKEFRVNSFHHYGISSLGEGLMSLSIAKDKSIESFKHKIFPVYGVMWHIEREGGMDGDNTFYQWKSHLKA